MHTLHVAKPSAGNFRSHVKDCRHRAADAFQQTFRSRAVSTQRGFRMSTSKPQEPTPVPISPSDGPGAGDHDEPYRFGRRPRASAPFPFTERQYVRLLIFRSVGHVRLDEQGITLRHYYFPFATSKHIRYDQIRRIDSQPMGWLSGRGRLWGTSSHDYWMPLELTRIGKRRMIILDLGRRVKPAFTPDDPDRVLQLIQKELGA
jgi:hypothetical protein